MNRIKKALEKCRTYVAVQKFGCGMTGIGHGVEDNILQFLNEADEELARLEKREPTLMSDCISAGLPLDVALKYDVQLCRLTNYVRDKTLADCVKQEPIDDELKAKLDAFSDLKTILFEPERWTVSEHATYFGFFCWGWKYAKKPYAAPVSAKAIRAEALEEAAKRCDEYAALEEMGSNEQCVVEDCAAAIRELK